MTINPYVKTWILLSLLYGKKLRCVCVCVVYAKTVVTKEETIWGARHVHKIIFSMQISFDSSASITQWYPSFFACCCWRFVSGLFSYVFAACKLAFDSKQYASYVDDRDRVVEITILPRDTLSYSSILLKTDALTSIWFSRASWKVHWNIECLWKFHNIVKIFLHILHLAPMTTSSTALRLVSKTREWKVKSDFIGSSTIRVIERTRWHTEEESAWNAFATVTAEQKFTG